MKRGTEEGCRGKRCNDATIANKNKLTEADSRNG